MGQIITSVATLITAAGSVWVSLRNSRKIDETHATVATVVDTVASVQSNVALVEKNTNSLKDALVASTAKASHAEGVADEQARAKEPAPVTIKNIAPIPVVVSKDSP